MQTTILDTHLHLYPCYNLEKAFDQFFLNTGKYAPDVRRVACLAERHDCQYYDLLARGEKSLPGYTLSGASKQQISLLRDSDQAQLTLLPGRQVISREKIEVLALACPERIDDGQPALDILYQIIQHSGVPVLPWSPGKWFSKRGELIKRLINELKAGDFLIGDTPLRPLGWPTPRLMKLAMNKGYHVVAGSDPLPFSGEESWLGKYHTVVQSNAGHSATELLHLLKNDPASLICSNAGKRSNVFTLASRLHQNAASKK